MRFRNILAVLMLQLCLLIAGPAWAQQKPEAAAGAAHGPLDPIQILIMVFDQVDEQRIIAMVNQRGISSHVDHDTLEMMRALVLPFQGNGQDARYVFARVEPNLRTRLERTPQSASLREQLAFVQKLEGTYNQSLATENQACAIGSLRTLNTAAVVYAGTYNVGFPSSLASLRPPDDRVMPSSDAAGLLDHGLASGKRCGYIFTYSPGERDSTGRINSYTIHAEPITPDADSIEPGTIGTSHFFTDQSGVIRSEINKPANEHSPPIAG